ncbi:hypothetical protein SODG_003021 [Sodalis praecaptivus]|nr:hypothetical protein NVIRENTERO_00418 [Sodalis praecaptivus]
MSSVNFGFRTGSYNLRAAADDKIDKDASARSNPNSGLWSKIKEIFHNGILKFTTKKQGSGDKTTKSIRTRIVTVSNPMPVVRRPADDIKVSNLPTPKGESDKQLNEAVEASIKNMKAYFAEKSQDPKLVEEFRETAYALALSNASDTLLAQREKHPELSINTDTGLKALNAVATDKEWGLTGSLGKDGRLNLKGAGMHALYSVVQNNMLFTAHGAKLGEEHKEQVCQEIYTLCDPADHKLTGFKTALDAAYDKWAVENKLKKSLSVNEQDQ